MKEGGKIMGLLLQIKGISLTYDTSKFHQKKKKSLFDQTKYPDFSD